MVDINDIRIGNCIQDNILHQGIVLTKETINHVYANPERFSGIWLDSDICRELKFKINSNDNDFPSYLIGGHYIFETRDNAIVLGEHIVTKCDNLHELQNFYYDIFKKKLPAPPHIAA